MRIVPSYQDYLTQTSNQNTGGSEAGQGTTSYMSEDTWNSLPDEEKFNNVGGGLVIGQDDPRYADVKPLVGGEEGRPVFVMPTSVGARGGLVDPHAEYHGDNFYAHSEDNQTPEIQAIGHDRSILPFIAAIGMPFAMAAGVGALGLGAETAGSSAAMIAGTDAAESAGTLALNAAGTGVSPYVAGEAAATGGAVAGATTGGEAATGAAPAAGAPAAPSTSPGLIDTVRNAGSNAYDWYRNLSPTSRFILNQGVSRGANAVIGGIQQGHAIDAARQQQEAANQHQVSLEDQRREDAARRSHVTDFGNAFKPRGIIDARRTGG